MTEENNNNTYFPLEITTHNIYFHEDSPILSCDGIKNILATSGYDKVIRIWKVITTDKKYEHDVYKLAAESSIKIEFWKELRGMKQAVNCIRFKQNSEFCLASCSDGGQVIVYDKDRVITVRKENGDDAYDLTWSENQLFVGFASGKVEVYDIDKANDNIDKEKDNIDKAKDNIDEANNDIDKVNNDIDKVNNDFKFVVSKKIHKETIQGICYNKKYGLIATHSLDKTVNIQQYKRNKLTSISTFSNLIDNSRGLFKRLSFIEDDLYIFTKNNIIEVYSYPYQYVHLRKRIGPLNSPVVKAIEYKLCLIILTKKSVYIFKNNVLICTVDSVTFKAVTDGFVKDDIIFVSSMDGFMTTIKFNSSNKFIG